MLFYHPTSNYQKTKLFSKLQMQYLITLYIFFRVAMEIKLLTHTVHSIPHNNFHLFQYK